MSVLKRCILALTVNLILTASVIASDYVVPTIENLPVFSSDGTKIGVLRKKIAVRKLRETPQMAMIEYSDDSVYFVGWVSKSYVTDAETKIISAPEATSILEKPAPKKDLMTKEDVFPEKPILSITDTRKNLRQILKVPVNYIQQTEINKLNNTGSKNKPLSTQQSKVFMRLNPGDKNSDGYAEITVLMRFERDSIVTFFVNEKIASLEEFKSQSASEFHQIIDLYIQALQKYNEDLRGNFASLCAKAEKYESIIK